MLEFGVTENDLEDGAEETSLALAGLEPVSLVPA